MIPYWEVGEILSSISFFTIFYDLTEVRSEPLHWKRCRSDKDGLLFGEGVSGLVDVKMDQSLKPAIHFDDLRVISTEQYK